MASKKSSLKIVLKKFPEQELLIKELYKVSDSFRSLCEDYVECMEFIKKLNYSDHMVQKGYREEYEALLQELEHEIESNFQEEI